MPLVEETDGQIVFIETVPTGVRIFLAIVGFIPLILAPYELLIRPSWQGFSLLMLIPIIIAVGAVAVGGLMVAAGLLGLNQTLLISAQTRTIHHAYESTLIPLRRRIFQFSDLVAVDLQTHDWSDGPATCGIQFVFTNGQKIKTGSFEKRNDAEHYVNRIKSLMR